MSGKLIGFYFKQVIGGLLTAEVLFPKYKEKVDAMRDDEWYEWDEYIEMVNELANKLQPVVVQNVGKQIVMQAKDLFVQQGFDSPDAILKDWNALFQANVKDAPARDAPRTTFYEPRQVVIEAGTAQPMPLIEGYLRGVVEMFGHYVASFRSEQIDSDQGPLFRFEMKWNRQTEPQPVL